MPRFLLEKNALQIKKACFRRLLIYFVLYFDRISIGPINQFLIIVFMA